MEKSKIPSTISFNTQQNNIIFMRLFIVGHPGYYGGASSELYHQIKVWHKGFPDLKLHIIPTQIGVQMEPMYQEMLGLGIHYEEARNYDSITKDDMVINFCSGAFLEDLEKIHHQTKRVAFVNCMTWTFPLEKEKAGKNFISHYLYQRHEVLEDHRNQLTKIGSTAHFLHFNPFFDSEGWSLDKNESKFTQIGRISRSDADKFAANTLHIYEYIVSPKQKRGHFLGFNDELIKKIGRPHPWITTYENQRLLPVKDFYRKVDFIVQPMDTMENLPRIGFEAMVTGTPLVVDNRGGWKHLVEHGVSGFLCNHERDFIYWGSRLAYEEDLRMQIAAQSRIRFEQLAAFDVSRASWERVFNSMMN